MFEKMIFAFAQAATEYLPISSSGHLALLSRIMSSGDLYFFTLLHIATLLPVIFIFRRTLVKLICLAPAYRVYWVYVIIGCLPAAIFGFLFHDVIESSFSSLLFLGLAYVVTSIILFSTRFSKGNDKIDLKRAIIIGIAQVFALFPGISRSGTTIAAAMLAGVGGAQAAEFSFIMSIPLNLGAFALEARHGLKISADIVLPFIACMLLGFVFLGLLIYIAKNRKLWYFSFYCAALAILSFCLYAAR